MEGWLEFYGILSIQSDRTLTPVFCYITGSAVAVMIY